MDTTRTSFTVPRPALRSALLICLIALASCQQGLQSISLTPIAPAAAKGTNLQLTAIGKNGDGSFLDLTSQVTWSSTDAAIATVANSTGHKGLVSALVPGKTGIAAVLGGVRAAIDFSVTAAALTSVTVSPPTATIAKGTTQVFSLTGIFSDGTHQDLTGSATWSTGQATITSLHLKDTLHEQATGLVSGSATLTATVQGKTATATLIVTDAALTSLSLNPGQRTIAMGTSTPLAAIGTFSDQSTQDLTTQVTWASLVPPIATVTRGLVQGLAAGSTTITATLGNQTAMAPITVTSATVASIAVVTQSPQIPMNNATAITATGTFSDQSTQDLTTQVQWVSSDPTIAAVSQDGDSRWIVTGLAQGTATLTATFGGVSGEALLAVSDATLTSISIAPVRGDGMLVGLASQLVATGNYSDGSTLDLSSAATWDSLSPALVSVGPRGLATPLGHGVASISATALGVTGTADLSIRLLGFGTAKDLGAPLGAGGMTIADLNGDGNLDLIATQSGSPAVDLLLGNGDGTFAIGGSYPTGPGPSGVAAADLNGDQIMDLITYNNGDHSISVLLGNTTGGFDTHLDYPDPCVNNGTSPISLIAADYNGDGNADIAAPCRDGSVHVLLGAGDGTLGLAKTSPAGAGAQRMRTADVDGDGQPDLLVSGTGGVSVLLGNGDGSFRLTSVPAGGPVSDVVAADVDGDGLTDLVALCDCGISLMRGQDGGTFGAPAMTVIPTALGLGIAVADVNGDGRPDVVLTGSAGFVVVQGKGDGTFLPAVTPGAIPVSQLALGDFNGDGLTDVLSTDGAKIYGALNTSQ